MTGLLTIRIVEGRNLAVNTPHPRPYCCVEFSKSEFVTREPVSLVASSPGIWQAQWTHEAKFDVAEPGGQLNISVWDRAAGWLRQMIDSLM
jgi:hypothetical protein